MSHVRITEAERASIIATRPRTGSERSEAQRDANRRIFAAIKSRYGVPSNHKVKVEIDAPGNPDYLVLKNKETGAPYTDLAARVARPAPVQAYPFDEAVSPRKPVTVKVPDYPQAQTAPRMPALKVHSINLEDALQLLRAEGDMCDSFATTTASVDGSISIKDGRLYFLA